MRAFNRIFKYVWPQWPSIIIVVVSAMIIAMLLSMSFMTIIPLLKVMIDKEGLHGWADRKACNWKYGVDFDVPETTDLLQGGSEHLAYYLLVTRVEKNSLADKAGLRPADRIIGAGRLINSQQNEEILFLSLLEELAAATGDKISIQLKRLDPGGKLKVTTVELNTPTNSAYVNSLNRDRLGRIKQDLRLAAADKLRWAVGLLPKDDDRSSKTKAVVFIIVLITIVTAIRCLAKYFQSYLAEKIVQVGINQMRDDAFGHAMNMPMGFFANERPSDVVSRIVRDSNVMGKAIKIMLGKALREPLNAIIMLSFAMLLNWQLTVIFLCGAPITLGLLMVFGRKMRKATKKSLVAGSQMLAKLQEVMAGLKVVKVYNRQRYEQENFKRINNGLLKQLLKISKVEAITNPAMELLGMIAGGAALVIGTQWVTTGRMDSPDFLVLILLLGASAEAVRKTSDIWNNIQEADAAAERVFAIIDEPVEAESADAIELGPLRDKIEFRDVVFTYPCGDRPVLRGINLSVRAGHNVAIVGPNGSGKTTLANLLPRFYDPDSGCILIDGQDIRRATLSSLRGQIAMVTQNVVTFNDTIAANIAYGSTDASREQIISAAKRSFAHEFILPLPEGYDTVIGEQGAGLSGGQLQRIIIARAILKNPSILIFDEATSQVDADSEAKIHNAIEEVMRDRTTILIAHRFSTVISADVIVVMDEGEVIAQGQHDYLMKNCSLYQSLYETQLITA